MTKGKCEKIIERRKENQAISQI